MFGRLFETGMLSSLIQESVDPEGVAKSIEEKYLDHVFEYNSLERNTPEQVTKDLKAFYRVLLGMEEPEVVLLPSPNAIKIKAFELTGSIQIPSLDIGVIFLSWIAFEEYFINLNKDIEPELKEKFDIVRDTNLSAFMCIPLGEVCLVSQYPSLVERDENENITRMVFKDGYEYYF